MVHLSVRKNIQQWNTNKKDREIKIILTKKVIKIKINFLN